MDSRFERVALAALGRALGREPSDALRRFAHSVGLLVGSDLVGTGLTFLITVWFVRTLGPTEFGKANLVVAISQFMLIPLLWGLHLAVANHMAAKDDRPATLGSTLVLLAICGTCVVPLAWVSAPLVSTRVHAETSLVRAGTAYAVVLALSFIVQGMLGGLQRFALIARLQLQSAVLLAVSAAALLLMTNVDYRHWVAVNALRFGGFAIAGGLVIRPMIGRPRGERCRSLFTLGSLHTLNALAYFFILGSIGNIMLNAYHGAAAVGILSAYFASFNILSSRITKAVSDVLQPMAAAHGVPSALRRAVLRGFLAVGWIVVPGTVALTFILFKFYGGAFVFDWRIATLMGLITFLFALSGALGDLLAAAGSVGMVRGVTTAVIAGGVNLVANWLLVGPYAVPGTLTAMLLGLASLIVLRAARLPRRSN